MCVPALAVERASQGRSRELAVAHGEFTRHQRRHPSPPPRLTPRAGAAEVLAAFDTVKPVRSLGEPALKVADRRFLKTILQLDPGRKGAPYTGLKPAGRSEARSSPWRNWPSRWSHQTRSPTSSPASCATAWTKSTHWPRSGPLGGALEALRGGMLGFEVDSHHVYEAIRAEGHAKHSDPLG